MDRKNFLKSASLLMGGATVAPLHGVANSAFGSQSLEPERLKKGISYYMIQEELSLRDKFELVRDLGFDGVEINSPEDFDMDELLDAKEKSGIEIPSVVNKHHWSKPLSDPDAAVRSFVVDSIAKSIDEVNLLGGDTVLVVPGVVNEQVPYGIAYRNALDTIRQLIPYAEKAGVKIGLENVWSNFILSPVEARNFVDEINHPLVGWYFDIGNIMRYGWPEHWIAELNRRIVKLHVKEFSRKKMHEEGLGKGFVAHLMAGDNDWLQVMRKIREVDYQGKWFTVEMDSGDRQYLRQLSQQMDTILSLQ